MTDNWKYRPLGWMVKALARLPFSVLYLLSDLSFPIVYYIARYRLKTVRGNLASCYPDKSQSQLRTIERKFYHNFCDYVVETLKLLHITDEQMLARMTFSNVEIIDDALAQERSVVCYFAHIGNWEYAPSIILHSRFKPHQGVEFCQIYRPLKNEWFDRLMLRIRGRFGAVSLQKRLAFLDLLRYRKQHVATVTGFMSDQKPSHGDPVHVVKFLNHPTAMITGTETVCRRMDSLPVYWYATKPSRGHYHIDVMPMTPDAEDTPTAGGDKSPYPLTDLYARMLQRNIDADPSLWLWSHKRWKNPVSFPQDTEPDKK